jgi:MoxR-like ATPase
MPIDSVQEVIAPTELKQIQASVRAVFVHESVRTYIVDIVSATRQSNQIMLGASPRGSLLLMHAAQAHAAYQGEDYVRPDDVKAMAAAVLAHRVIPRADLRSRGVSAEEIVEEIVDSIRVPVPAK